MRPMRGSSVTKRRGLQKRIAHTPCSHNAKSIPPAHGPVRGALPLRTLYMSSNTTHMIHPLQEPRTNAPPPPGFNDTQDNMLAQRVQDIGCTCPAHMHKLPRLDASKPGQRAAQQRGITTQRPAAGPGTQAHGPLPQSSDSLARCIEQTQAQLARTEHCCSQKVVASSRIRLRPSACRAIAQPPARQFQAWPPSPPSRSMEGLAERSIWAQRS